MLEPTQDTSLKYDVHLSVRIPADLRDKARAKAQETGIAIAHVVRQALERSGGSVPRAAKLLGLSTKTLEARMGRLGLAKQAINAASEKMSQSSAVDAVKKAIDDAIAGK